jgi:cytochrome c-type biogenesis protein CcmH
MIRAITIVFICCFSVQCLAVDTYQLTDPDQQKVYETLTAELRCLVCQNQNIADSNAELAGDLRRQVYEMLQQGKSKAEIVDFMTARYGDFVLYNPPFKAKTGMLWLGPFAFLIVGFVTLFFIIKRRKIKKQDAQPSSDRLEKVRRLLQNGDDS